MVHDWKGKFVIHSELYNPSPSKQDIVHARKVSDEIDKAFKSMGVDKLYTWAETEEQDRYNKFLGYVPTGKTVNDTFQEENYPNEVREYVKELR